MSLSETPPVASPEARYRVSVGRCQWCNATFPPGPSRGPARRWCSERCRWQARKAQLLEARALLADIEGKVARVRRLLEGP
jgi:hypothetical protein